MTPLKKSRVNSELKLSEVVARLKLIGVSTDTGNLSRIERGLQTPSTELAEALTKVFPELTEIHVLYPGRYREEQRPANVIS